MGFPLTRCGRPGMAAMKRAGARTTRIGPIAGGQCQGPEVASWPSRVALTLGAYGAYLSACIARRSRHRSKCPRCTIHKALATR